jgi:hypothetical protein
MVSFGIGSLVASGMQVGYLQGASCDFAFEEASLYSGAGRYPIDVRIHTATITGTSSFADIDVEALKKLLGGTNVGSVLTITNTSAPSYFQLVFTTTTDSISLIITLLRAKSSSLSMAFERTAYTIPEFNFSAYADGSGNVCTIDAGEVS